MLTRSVPPHERTHSPHTTHNSGPIDHPYNAPTYIVNATSYITCLPQRAATLPPRQYPRAVGEQHYIEPIYRSHYSTARVKYLHDYVESTGAALSLVAGPGGDDSSMRPTALEAGDRVAGCPRPTHDPRPPWHST